MRPLPLIASLLLAGCASTPAVQRTADEREVLALAQCFFDIMASGDARAGAELTVPEGVFINVRDVEGVPTIRHFTNADWVAGLPGNRGRYREWFVGEPVVHVAGDVAVVWGRYEFEIDGTVSHSGTDAMVFVRGPDGWKLAGGGYDVQRQR